MNLFRGNAQDFHALFTRFSWPKLRVFLWVQPMRIPLKKPWKYFEKFTINGPWNSLGYKKCNEKHMKWLFLITHEFDLLWDFHGVQEKAMKYIPIFHGVKFMAILWDGKFKGHDYPINRVLFWPFHSICMAHEMYFVPCPLTFSWVKVMAKWYHENGIKRS